MSLLSIAQMLADRGYASSAPLGDAPYDLIVDTNQGLLPVRIADDGTLLWKGQPIEFPPGQPLPLVRRYAKTPRVKRPSKTLDEKREDRRQRYDRLRDEASIVTELLNDPTAFDDPELAAWRRERLKRVDAAPKGSA